MDNELMETVAILVGYSIDELNTMLKRKVMVADDMERVIHHLESIRALLDIESEPTGNEGGYTDYQGRRVRFHNLGNLEPREKGDAERAVDEAETELASA